MKMVTSSYPLALRGWWRRARGSVENRQPNAARLGGAAVHPHRVLKAPVRPGWRRTREHGGRHRCSEFSQTRMAHLLPGSCLKESRTKSRCKNTNRPKFPPVIQSSLNVLSPCSGFIASESLVPDFPHRSLSLLTSMKQLCRIRPRGSRRWTSGQKMEECGAGTRQAWFHYRHTWRTDHVPPVSGDVLPTPPKHTPLPPRVGSCVCPPSHRPPPFSLFCPPLSTVSPIPSKSLHLLASIPNVCVFITTGISYSFTFTFFLFVPQSFSTNVLQEPVRLSSAHKQLCGSSGAELLIQKGPDVVDGSGWFDVKFSPSVAEEEKHFFAHTCEACVGL